MSEPRYRDVKEVLATVLERRQSEREAELEARCGHDPALRREVESLLAFATTTRPLSGTPLVSIRPGEDEARQAGEHVGPYRIMRSLGCGGMGEVYLAWQEGSVERSVALKLIHRGMNTNEILKRFHMERQILASLNHPHISGLLHAGATDDGRPYFAMEYIEGQRIDHYCDAHGLSVRQRLELFLKVCSAVHFSHQKLVVHRDLKPANILVTADGTPKLLDFGIAKLLEPSRSFTTQFGRRPMTPAYASPELLRHQPVTTSTDVYSLGVLLYVLLTGRHPYRIAGRRGDEVGRIVCEEEPRKPSTVAGRELAGDLDSILLQALRKEPEERYGSVEKLADDLQRHLEGRPVSARAATWRYRAGKFARRHRAYLATVVAFALVVAGFVVALVVQLGRVQLERDRGTMASDLFAEIMETSDPREEEANLAPEEVVQRGVALFGESFHYQHEVQGDVLNSLGRVYMERGSYDSAIPLLEEALSVRLGALGENHMLVGESRLNLGALFGAMGENEEAEQLTREGLAIFRRYFGRGPHRQLARGISTHATQLYLLGRYEEAEKLYREALDMRIQLYGELHLEVATSLSTLGNLYRATKDDEKALDHYRRALDIRRRLLPTTHPEVARSYGRIGMVLSERGEIEEAEPLLRDTLAIRMANHGDRHRDVATSRYTLAVLLHNSGREDEAETLYRQALEVRREQDGEDHIGTARIEKHLAALLLERGDLEAARRLALHALEIIKREGSATQIADAESLLADVLEQVRTQKR